MSDIIENDTKEVQTSLRNVQDIPEEIYENSKNENSNKEIEQININRDLEQQESNLYNENLYIDLEMNKKEKNYINITEDKKEDIEKESDNINKINIISNNEDENNTELESLKIDEYLEQENIKSNKENDIYDDTDLRSCRLTERNNNDKYLLIKEENHNKIENNNSDDDDENDEKEDDLFPFRIIGDAKKKSEHLGKYNSRYLELDSKKGLFKRYMSSKDYPKKPKEIIDIRNFKLLKKLKLVKDYYDLEITYTVTKKGHKTDKVESFRMRHSECRNKWFDSLLLMWKHLIKGEPIPKITKDILCFVDDRIGIIQEIGRKNKKNKKKSVMDLKKFKILGLLGVGGFGTVFKVQHILTEKIYAMKVMNKNYIIKKKYLHYIVSEFEIMKSLAGFPFVLDLHYCFQSANFLYLIIDYCPNGDFTKLKSINNLKLFFAEVILAFEHIHNHNIIYRDLKPENILLDSTGHIRVCDFNLAKAGMTKNKRADSFCGSPLYFSPEMVLGKGVDYRCDIYGIGLLMYELVTGMPAFNAKDIKSLYELIKKNQIDFKVSGLHGDIKDLIEKILVKDPEQRIELEDMKKHPYFKDIDFDKVLKKEYGKIETVKISKDKNENNNKENKILTEEEKEKLEYKKFKLQQQKLDENKEYTFLDGKISVKEMMLDTKRVMKNFVREFYYVKKEDIEQTKDFKLDAKEDIDISSLIIDNYDYEV